MEDKLKLMLFKIIYDKLKLNEFEKILEDNNIPTKTVVVDPGEILISKYFFLKNDIQTVNLTQEEVTMINNYLNNFTSENSAKLNQFLANNIYRLLLPKTEEKYLCWPDRHHEAPADAIVISFHTIDFVENEAEDNRRARDHIVYPILNKIQKESQEKFGLKVAVLKYNEIPIHTIDNEQLLMR